MTSHTIGFTGTRQGLTNAQFGSLCQELVQLRDLGFTTLVHGDCVGADSQVHDVAVYAFDVHIRPPSNNTLRANSMGAKYTASPKPYLERNREIVETSAVLVGCPKGDEIKRSGTWSTIRYARRTGKTIIIIKPDGVVLREEH
jgi:hypothetical protein